MVASSVRVPLSGSFDRTALPPAEDPPNRDATDERSDRRRRKGVLTSVLGRLSRCVLGRLSGLLGGIGRGGTRLRGGRLLLGCGLLLHLVLLRSRLCLRPCDLLLGLLLDVGLLRELGNRVAELLAGGL